MVCWQHHIEAVVAPADALVQLLFNLGVDYCIQLGYKSYTSEQIRGNWRVCFVETVAQRVALCDASDGLHLSSTDTDIGWWIQTRRKCIVNPRQVPHQCSLPRCLNVFFSWREQAARVRREESRNCGICMHGQTTRNVWYWYCRWVRQWSQHVHIIPRTLSPQDKLDTVDNRMHVGKNQTPIHLQVLYWVIIQYMIPPLGHLWEGPWNMWLVELMFQKLP